ncbi:MAG: hypothetical protein ACYSWU_01995 [Planctomycetota bacterium]|jgi:hypothetical protein
MKLRRNIFSPVILLMTTVVPALAQSVGEASAQRPLEPFADAWTHVSPTSVIVYWQTGDDARRVESAGRGYVEYGPTAEYGRKTETFDLPPVCEAVPEKVRVFRKPSWSQFHRLLGLEAGRACHYRMVYVAPDGTATKGEDKVLIPKVLASAIALPGDLKGPPYVLDQTGATYVLTADVAAEGTAFEIGVDDVTLELDGHTVVFGRTAGGNVHGIHASGRRGIRLFGGMIEEGPGPGRRRFPVFMQGCRNVEIAGISATYHGKDGQGILFNWQGEGSNVHHNVVYDRGAETTSRHQQIAAIHFSPAVGSSGARVHHNIVLRARQTGIQFGASEAAAREGKVQSENIEIANNMVYLGSCMTNSMGVSASGAIKGFVLRDNRIYGRGEMPECIFVGTGASYGRVLGNYTYSRSTGKVSQEYGSTSSLSSGLRMCWGPHHLDVHDNTFITSSGVNGDFHGNARCIWAACSDPRQPEWKTSGEIAVRNNQIVAMLDESGDAYARAITVCGHHKASSRGLVLRNNRITTNAHCVVLSESYGCGSSDVQFIGNTFVKAGSGDAFAWLHCGYWDKPTTGSSFVDSRFAGGASPEDVRFHGTARREFCVGWTLSLKTAPGAEVVITDTRGKEVFRGEADEKGRCRAPLMHYLHTPEGKTIRTPHKVMVSRGGRFSEQSVVMDQCREIQIQP